MAKRLTGVWLAAIAFLAVTPAPGAAQLLISPAVLTQPEVSRSASNAEAQLPPNVANMGGGIILAWMEAGAGYEDGYAHFKADVTGEVGLASWDDDQPFVKVPALFAANQVAGSGGGARLWRPSLLAGFSFMKGNFGSGIAVTGGFRMTRKPSTPTAMAFFGEVRAGLHHDEFSNAFTMLPGGGVLFPMPGKRFLLIGRFNYGLVFYDGYTGKGPQFSGGIGIPIGGN